MKAIAFAFTSICSAIILHMQMVEMVEMAEMVLSQKQKQPHFQGNRTVMVHLFEWTWPAIAKECEDFLGPNGYGGVQISPPNECRIVASRPWWERYQPISYQLHSRSGNETQLRDMIARCNRVGVRIYVDAVINHMSGRQADAATGTAGSKAYYAQQQYPAVPYGPPDFNAPCEIRNYADAVQVRNCQLVSLLDLNLGKTYVRDTIAGYMNRLIDMGVAGFRIDAAKHMWPADLAAIFGQLHNLNATFGYAADARPFIYQEVIDLGTETIKSTEYTAYGCVTEFKHSRELGRAFRRHNDLRWLHNWGPAWTLLPSADALVFIDNHDNQRAHGAGGAEVLTHKDGAAYRMATIFMLAHPYGQVVRIMSSYGFTNTDQGPPATKQGEIIAASFQPADGQCDTAASGWICEHRWPELARMVAFRNAVGTQALAHWWDNAHNQLAFGRAGKGFIAINIEPQQQLRQTVQTGLPPGVYCDVISGGYIAASGQCGGRQLTVNSQGYVTLALPEGYAAVAMHVNAKL